jgi:hypothetical protein
MNAFGFVDILKVLRDTLEVVSFASAPVLAWLAFKALNQIQVSKEIARTQASRESFRLATERCKQFADEILPLAEELRQLFLQKKLPEFQKIVVTESPENISIDWKNSPNWMADIDKHRKVTWELANDLEAWSMWFTCRIADENIAYSPCGVSFCNCVRPLLPLLMFTNKNDKWYSHTLELYMRWKNRIDHDKNIAKQQQLEKERMNLKFEIPKPIGT